VHLLNGDAPKRWTRVTPVTPQIRGFLNLRCALSVQCPKAGTATSHAMLVAEALGSHVPVSYEKLEDFCDVISPSASLPHQT
jgi:hypothetical protein